MWRLHNCSHCANGLRDLVTTPPNPPFAPTFQLTLLFPLFCLQEGFVEFFQVSDPESTVRNMLMAVAGVAGLGATLALLIR